MHTNHFYHFFAYVACEEILRCAQDDNIRGILVTYD